MVLEDCVTINYILYYRIYFYPHSMLSSNVMMELYLYKIIFQLQYHYDHNSDRQNSNFIYIYYVTILWAECYHFKPIASQQFYLLNYFILDHDNVISRVFIHFSLIS